MDLRVNLHHVIYALSDALDLVGVDDLAHGKRVGIMAGECSKALGWTSEQADFMFDLGLLHDIGVSSTATHSHLVAEFDWVGSQAHAKRGHQLLQGFAPLAAMALPVRYHHTVWHELERMPELDPAVALQANLIFLVDRVDALAASHIANHDVLPHASEIRHAIEQREGHYFCPALVQAFLQASRTESFWLRLEPRSIQICLQEQLARTGNEVASAAELMQVARMFARIVDAKSPFTAEHSQGVALLSRLLAGKMGVSADHCDKIEIAGLLHDLGKLRVPDEILEKPARLSAQERHVINAHSFETYQILHPIQGFEEVATWAACHHEEPDGSGYPFGLREADMPLEAHILRVADIFQAMVQNRPYRSGLSASDVMRFMHEMADNRRVDARIVAVLESCLDEAMAAALPQSGL